MNSVHLEDLKLKTLDLHVGYSTSSRKTFHLCFLTSFIAGSKMSSVCRELKRLLNKGCLISAAGKRHTNRSLLYQCSLTINLVMWQDHFYLQMKAQLCVSRKNQIGSPTLITTKATNIPANDRHWAVLWTQFWTERTAQL